MPQPSDVTPGYLVWRLSMRWQAATDRAVASLGLTQAQFSLLASLYGLSRSGWQPSQRELADYAALEPIFVSKLARTLEAAGLIRRAEHPGDSRAVQLSLTDQGAQTAERAIAVVRELQEELTAPLGGVADMRTRDLMGALRELLGLRSGITDITDTTDTAGAAGAADTTTAAAAATSSTTASTVGPDAAEHPGVNRPQNTKGSDTVARTPTLTGQDIGAAANSTRAILHVLLARSSTTFPQWAVLRTLAARGPVFTRDDLAAVLTAGLAVDPSTIPDLLGGLETKGFIRPTDDGFVDLGPDGRALYDRVNDALATVVAQIYGDLDPDDLAVTRRVLVAVAERADALRGRL